jgi:hypothetical protein
MRDFPTLQLPLLLRVGYKSGSCGCRTRYAD